MVEVGLRLNLKKGRAALKLPCFIPGNGLMAPGSVGCREEGKGGGLMPLHTPSCTVHNPGHGLEIISILSTEYAQIEQ